MTRWLNDTEMRAWRTVISSTYALFGALDRELQAEHGLTLAEYELLALLSESPDRRRRMSDLACQLHVSPSGMTRRIDGLVRRGWVERAQCPEDRRGSLAVLTDEGFEVLRAAAPTHVRGVREHFIDRLTERQLANVTAALDKVADSEPGRD